MPDATDSPETLNIRCPSCRQRFSVGGNLRDRMVECGACDSRFRIIEDVILRSKKFYPGERRTDELTRFQRVPLSAAAPEGLQTIRYADFNHHDQLEPTSPQRIIGAIIGVGLMAVIALMFIFASGPGGSLGAMPLENKLILGGFISTLGTFLLINGNPKARIKAGAVGMLLTAGMLTIPFFIKGPEVAPAVAGESPGLVDPTDPLFSAEEKDDPIAALRDRFSTNPLEVEQKRLESTGSGRNAYGIFLTNILQRNIYTVRDFLIRETMAGASSHPYPRDNGDYLMVLTDVSMGLTEVADIAARLGTTKEIHPEIGIIVVTVDNEQFLDSAADKLNNQKDPAFYSLNQRELVSLDMDRVKRAVERLANAEPSIYREDISTLLLKLMEKPGIGFHDELAKTLLVWLQDPGLAGESALKALQGQIAAGERASENLVILLLKGKNQAAIPSLHTLWLGDPLTWEHHYAEFGPVIEPSVLEHLNSEKAPLRRSAINLLGRTGTDASLPPLGQLAGSLDPEIRVLAERAIKAIKER
jgi:hypothetical protein